MSLSILQRLNICRQEFADARIEPTGINRHQQYTYYELEDIVPTARKILTSHGLMLNFQYWGGIAYVEIVSIDGDNADKVTFQYEFRRSEAYKGMNDIQSYGADLKYLRRYCYMCVFDITEPDEINQMDTEEVPVQTFSAPVTPTKSEEPSRDLSEVNEASTEAKKLLIDKLRELKSLDPEQDEFVQEVLQSTQNLKTISEAKCMRLMGNVGKMIAEYKETK